MHKKVAIATFLLIICKLLYLLENIKKKCYNHYNETEEILCLTEKY